MFTILFFEILIKVHEFIILNLKNLKKKNAIIVIMWLSLGLLGIT